MKREKLRQMARLHQLHQDTHPERVARAFGVTGYYVRKCWADLQGEMAPTDDALQALRGAK